MTRRKRRKKFTNILFILAIAAILVIGAAVFFTSTRPGLRLMTRSFITDFIPAQEVAVGDVTGQLSDELVFSQVELNDLKWFPEDTVVRIQRLTIRLQSLNPHEAEIDFENIRIFMPYSDPIVISGNYRAGHISCNVYTSNIAIEEFLSLLPQKPNPIPKGVITDIDLYLEGPLQNVNAKGTFVIQELLMPMFVISEAPGEVDLLLRRTENGYSPLGSLQVAKGKVATKNALLRLEQSRLLFSGSFENPAFDVRGTSSIGKVDIDVALLGNLEMPQWKFNSNPYIEEEVLMLMFLTGKNMETVQASIEHQKMTPDLAKDMADYFLLGGEAGRIAQKLGIKDVSIIYEKDSAGIGVKKEVTDFLDLGYQFEQKGGDSQATELKHTLGADVKLNKNFSLELDKELYQYHNQERFYDMTKPDDRILLKYKTRF